MGIPPLEQKKRPLIVHWWFLLIIFVFSAIAGTFGLLVYKNIQAIRSGNLDISGELTKNPDAQAAAVNFANVVTTDDPSLGTDNAKVTIVEFSDFQCPFCQEAFPIVREIMNKYEGSVKFIYRDFPVSSLHADAELAAEAGGCVAEQNLAKFWGFHDQLFINQADLSQAALTRYASNVGVDTDKFTACLNEHRYADEVASDYKDGVAAGVTGTPTFFINGRRVPGVIPLDIFKSVIDRLLES